MNISACTSSRLLAATAMLLFPMLASLAQQPPVTPPPSYTPPEPRLVLAGTAPMRVLVVSRMAMLAWKGGDEVRVLDANARTPIYAGPADEQVGVANLPQDGGTVLRKAGKSFHTFPGAIRLESAKPLKLWTPDPDRWTTYPCPLVITPTADGKFSVAREMALDEYLRNVVPSEMPATFHAQALRAQAIIARTYTLAKLGRHTDEGADLCATVHCQAFSDDSKRTKATDDALAATRGVVLYNGAELATTYYHSSCGGATDDAGYIWGPVYAQPYLTGGIDYPSAVKPTEVKIEDVLARKDAYCKEASNSRWTRTFTAAQVDALVSKNLTTVTGDPTLKINRVTNMTVEQRTPFGRVATMRVEGDGASVLVYGDQVRWLFGDGNPGANGLWSTLFTLTLARDTNDKITGYTFTGAGRGHGLGLCQWGANGRARAGQNYREILRAYYPGTRLSDEKE